jgi:hypothetical protein
MAVHNGRNQGPVCWLIVQESVQKSIGAEVKNGANCSNRALYLHMETILGSRSTSRPSASYRSLTTSRMKVSPLRKRSPRSWWRRAIADRLYLALLAVLALIQALTSVVDWCLFTHHLAREGIVTWALGSPLLCSSCARPCAGATTCSRPRLRPHSVASRSSREAARSRLRKLFARRR